MTILPDQQCWVSVFAHADVTVCVDSYLQPAAHSPPDFAQAVQYVVF